MEDYENIPIGDVLEDENSGMISPSIDSTPPPSRPVTNTIAIDDSDWTSIPEGNPFDDMENIAEGDPNEEDEALTVDEIKNNPLKMTAIRSYMIDRLGPQWEKKDNEEVFSTFVSRMRFMNTNELRTLSEARYIQQADEDKKNKAGTAYQIYDELAPFWSSGTSKTGAVFDYTKALFTSPSTYIGGIIGKGVAGASTKAFSASIMAAARQAARTGGTNAAKAVLTSAARAKVAAELGTAAAIDSGVGVLQEKTNQDIRMDTGIQDDYDYTALSIALGSGVLGGAVASVPHISKSSKFGTKFDENKLSKVINKNNSIVLSGMTNTLTAAKTPADPEYAKYMASLWRRMLVSHPGTTAVNVQGWGIAHFARTIAELVNGGTVGTAGMIGRTMNASWAPDALKQSKDLISNVNFKSRMLLDPYTSRKAFDALLTRAPQKVQQEIIAEAFGGVARANMADSFGMHGAPEVVKKGVRGAEWVADKAAALTLIKAQDVYTKTFSALGELDRLSRLKLGTGIEDIVNDGRWNDITDDMWHDALTTMTEDTFSKNYAKGNSTLNQMADLVERVSNMRYLGFLFPFGRFMNNNIAYTMQYSPIGFIKIASAMKKGGALREQGVKALLPSESNLGQDIAKSIVGTTALVSMMNYSMEMQDKGFQWFENEDSRTGDITTEENLAPISALKLLARIGGHIRDGEAVPQEMWAELGDQLGPWQWSREVTGSNPVSDTLGWLSQESNPALTGEWQQLAAGAMDALTNQVVSGYTRPLDPLNKVVGLSTETDYAIDRRMPDSTGEKLAVDLSRYTDNLFDAILEEPIGTPLRQASRPEGDIKEPNPVGSMFGRKEVVAKNYIDQALGMVDMPAYLLDQRSNIPEADRFMNEMVGPILNMRSKALIKDKSFQKASIAIKREMVKMMLTNARDEIKGRLENGLIGTREDNLAAARRTWLSMPVSVRNEARTDLNIATPDRDLTEQELMTLKLYASQLRSYLKSRSE